MGTHQRSECTPSMSAELTPDLMMTERKCTRVAGKLSELNILKLPGRRSTMNGARDHTRSFPSGSVRDPARRRENLRLLRERRERRLLQLRRIMRKKRRRKRSMMKRRNKHSKTNTIIVQVLK